MDSKIEDMLYYFDYRIRNCNDALKSVEDCEDVHKRPIMIELQTLLELLKVFNSTFLDNMEK